jgi:hypothetical protein
MTQATRLAIAQAGCRAPLRGGPSVPLADHQA